jgi:hypothetical protein
VVVVGFRTRQVWPVHFIRNIPEKGKEEEGLEEGKERWKGKATHRE